MFKISKYLNVGISFHDSSDTKDTHSVDKNRAILIDEIKTLQHVSRSYVSVPRFSIYIYIYVCGIMHPRCCRPEALLYI